MKLNISPTAETNLRTLAVFAAILTITGYLGSLAAASTGLYVSLALTVAFSATILWFSREIAVWLMDAKEVQPGEKLEGFDLLAMVYDLSQHKQIQLKKMPKVCIIESHKINAFATGPHRNHTAIAITTGLLKKALKEAQGDRVKATNWIKAIWCHELGHIVNRDIATKTTVTIFGSALRIFSESIYQQRRDREENKNNTRTPKKDDTNQPSFMRLLGEYILLYWLVPFTGTLLSLCLSRTREFAADDMAQKCGYGKDLAEAFDKLFRDTGNQSKKDDCNQMDALASMMCMSVDSAADSETADAIKTEKNWFTWGRLHYQQYKSTHPTIDARIERLNQNHETQENVNIPLADSTRDLSPKSSMPCA